MDNENLKPENDQMIKPTNNFQMAKPIKKPHNNTAVFILVALLVAGVAAGAAYWWRGNSAKDFEKLQSANYTVLQQKNTSLEKQLADEKAKNTATAGAEDKTACTPKSPTATVLENIKLSITSANTAALEGYMASSVNVVTAASGGVGAKTPTEAIKSISKFLTTDLNSWDYVFSLPSATLSSYSKSSYGQYFPSIAVVGKATNKQVISFSFDCNAKISTVFMAANENLIK